MKKKILGILLAGLVSLQCVVPAMAAGTPKAAESVTVENGNKIQIYTTEDGDSHTIYWAKGVDGPLMSGKKGSDGKYGDFRRTLDLPGNTFESLIYSMGYETGKGYYDLNKKDPQNDHRCYMAAAQNVLYWWMDQNSSYIDQYIEGLESGRFEQSENLASIAKEDWTKFRTAPDSVYKSETNRKGQYIDDSYIVQKYYGAYNSRQTGYYMDKVADFFINGYLPTKGDLPNDPEEYEQSKNGGFFYPVFGKDRISVRHNKGTYQFFNENMKKWIVEGQGITVAHEILGGSHAISVWGVEYDEKGNLCKIYVTDSNDLPDEVFKDSVGRGMFAYDITEKNGIAYMGTYTDKVNRPGTMLREATTIDLCQDEWETILNDTDTEPASPEIKANPEGRSYGKNATADPLKVTAKISKEEIDNNAYLSYQWYKADSEDTKGTPIEGATKDTYVPVIGDTPATEYYYCEITNNKYGKKTVVKTEVAKIETLDVEAVNAKAPKIITNLKTPVEYTEQQKTGALKVAAESVDNGQITYQWYSSLDASPSNGTPIKGATSNEFMPPTNVVGDNFYYFCKITNTNEAATGTKTNTVNSNMVRVKVKEGLVQEPLKIVNVPVEVKCGSEFELKAEGGSGATSVLTWEITEESDIATVEKTGEFTAKVKVTGTGTFTVKATNIADKFIPVSTEATMTSNGHTYGDWKSDADNHWHECIECYEKKDLSLHNFEWVVDRELTEELPGLAHEECTVCGYKKAQIEFIKAEDLNPPIIKPQHTPEYVQEVPSTCTTHGTKAHYHCSHCNKNYEDEECTVEITELTLPLKDHNYKEEWNSDADNHWHECTECQDKKDKALHTFEWVKDREPSKELCGLAHEECTECGYKKAQVEYKKAEELNPPIVKPDPEEKPDSEEKPNPEVKPDPEVKSEPEVKPAPEVKPSDKENTPSTPATGDTVKFGLWIALLVAAAVTVVAIIISRKKK